MNILIVTSVFPPEPVTTASMNYDLAVALSVNHEVTVLRTIPSRPAGRDYSNYSREYPFECIELNAYRCPESKMLGRLRESYSFGKACANYIKEHHADIDVVYNTSWHLFGYYLVARACVKYKVPYIIPIQDVYPETILTARHFPKLIEGFIKQLLLPIDKYYLKHANKIRTISNEMADYISNTRNIRRDKFLILDNWQNDEDFFYRPVDNDKLIFGYVGSINSHSNTELIIEAFAKANISNSELRIYGGGNHKDSCVELVKRLGVENVYFDVVGKKDVPNVQASTSVLVLALPTGNGGICLPSKMTSYMLSGRAILASVEDSATTRYIKEADCGIAVTPDDIDALADAFRYYASVDSVELNRLGINSRRFAEQRLTRTSNLSKVIHALENAEFSSI